MEQNQPGSLFGMELDNIAQSRLNTIAKWAKFVAICFMIFTGLIILVFVAARERIMDSVSGMLQLDRSAIAIVIIVLVAFCAFFIIGSYFLLKSAVLIRQGLVARDVDRIAEGFRLMRVYFIITVSISILSILSSLSGMLIS